MKSTPQNTAPNPEHSPTHNHHANTSAHDHHHEGVHAHLEGTAEHAHETILINSAGMFLSMMDHEGSLVASYRLSLPGDLPTAKQSLSEFASSLADEVSAQGGVVGHIKAFAREQGASFRLSVTVHDPDIIEFDERAVRVEGVAIVYGVDRAWYENVCTKRLKTLGAN